MNPLLRWLTSPEWTHVVGALLHSLWQGALIAIALAVLMRRFINPVTRYRCALGLLGVLVTAAIITWAVLNTPKSVAPISASIPAAELEYPATPTGDLNLDAPDSVVVIGKISAPATPTDWTAWLALVWMVGAMVMLLRAGIKVAGAENLRRSCQPLTDETMISLVAEACRAVELGRKIRVAVTDKLTSPAVVGVIVPTLILPLSLFSALTPEQIRFILLHELAHIRRGDYFANLFQLFAEALLFFNPAVWWISHQIRREREACCDALAIELSGAPADYAATLVRVAENILQPAPTAAIAFGEDGREPSPLAERVQRVLVPDYRPSLRLTWRAILTSLIVGGTLLVLSAIGTRNTVGAILTSSPPTNSAMPLGPEINPDVPLSVSGDDPNIQTTLIPTLTESVGYDLATAAMFVPTPITGTGQSIDSVLPLPIFRVRQITTSHNVGDGQTNELGGLHPDNVAKLKDKVPFLGDLPLIGKLFTSESSRMHSVPTVRVNDSFDIDDWTVTENEQLNKQWFWYRGGDTITWPTTATTNTTTAEPLAERTFSVDLGLFYAAVRKSAGFSEPVTQTNVGHAIRPFFANAGVNLDPVLGKGFFLSTSRGDMWVRATWPELDAIEALLRSMPGTRLIHRTYHLDSGTLAKITAVLSPEISSIVATNPAAGFRALLEFFNPNDPRPKQVRYLADRAELYARATEADFERFDSTLNGLLRIKPAPEATRRSDSSSSTNLSAATSKAGFPIERLYTREFTLPVNLAYEKILTNFTLPEWNRIWSHNRSIVMHEHLRDWFMNVGVNLDPQWDKALFYNDRKGILFVHATMVELDSIETTLRTLQAENILPLFTRTFQVEPGAIAQAIETMAPQFKPVTATNITDGLRALLQSSGADLSPPKSIYYNYRAGGLFVRATKEDLDAIESLLQIIGRQPAQVNLKAVFVDVSSDKNSQMEIAKLLGSAAKTGSAAEPFGTNFTGILTDLQFRVLLRALESHPHTEILSTPQVTTLSGRQAQIQVSDIKTIVNGITAVVTNGTTNFIYQSQAMPFGPVLDILPIVSHDGYTIQMTLIPTVTEFLGYEDAKDHKLSPPDERATLPLPRFRTRQMTTSAVVWDGQTIVLGNFSDRIMTTKPDGTSESKPSAEKQNKQLLIFVTPTIIDQAGNRANSDVGLPSKLVPSGPVPMQRP